MTCNILKVFNLFIFLLKELSIDVSDAAFLMRHLADVHAQVGTEAARLSKFNRRRVITQRELHNAAVRALRDKCAWRLELNDQLLDLCI